ncbi:MAG: PstS family phosphate ABC transporter substrate-binding protein [Acidobacteria bacterium]|nr:MAG: PstS family phosphate ABC transporter substrate-binding protein [Acidobacteriota bacterium]
MRILFRGLLTFPLAAALVVLSGCGGDGVKEGARGVAGSITVDGSSTVFPITEAMAEEFRREQPDVRVTVGVSGTGGGFKKFSRGEIDICDASRPIKDAELQMARQNKVDFVELPVAYDGIAILVNPKNTWCESITVEELKRLWEPSAQNKVTRWNQVRPNWPDREIHLFGPGVDSGTYDYFTGAIVGKEGASRGDFTSSEDDNVLVQGIAADELALGFFGYAYYEENKDRLRVVPVNDGNPQNGDGPIVPTVDTVKNSTYQPLSRPIFIYVRRESLDRSEVSLFIDFYLKNAPSLVSQVGYIPLPDEAYQLAHGRVARKVTGSVFAGGSQVGVSVQDLLKKESAAAE